MKRIARLIETRKKKIEKLEQEIKQIQESCSHPDLKKTYGANTGNYDPSADCYWVTYDCPDCQKHWTMTKNAGR